MRISEGWAAVLAALATAVGASAADDIPIPDSRNSGFAVSRRYINFRIRGERNLPGIVGAELLVEGRVVRAACATETADPARAFHARTWDVASLAGRTVRIRVNDRSATGAIAVDGFTQSDTPAAPPVDASVPFDETYRPQFHFTAAAGWLNDANGLLHHRGEWHLFHQHRPPGAPAVSWGHAVSDDLLHWRHLPVALPNEDRDGIFSGSGLVDAANASGLGRGGEPPVLLFYTLHPASDSGRKAVQCMAVSTDGARTFAKHAGNPLLQTRDGNDRDPKVFFHAPTRAWFMVLSLSRNNTDRDHATYGLYRSRDLKGWELVQEIGPGAWYWECPDMFEMPVADEPGQTRWVLAKGSGDYIAGSFDGSRFTPETEPVRTSWGAAYYGAQTFNDARGGRRIQVAWMNSGPKPQIPAAFPGMPFNQQMSFPRELTLRRTDAGLRLFREPVAEISNLVTRTHTWPAQTLSPGTNLLAGIGHDLLDIALEIEPARSSRIVLTLRGAEVTYDVAKRKLGALGRTLDLTPIRGRIVLRVLLDRASLEIFGNDGDVTHSGIFFPDPANRALALAVEGGPAPLTRLEVRELKSIWSREAATNSIGMRLVSIGAGSFQMGQDGPPADHRMTAHPARCDDADWDEAPAHRVTITAPFRIGATEVTCGQYRWYKPGFGGEAHDDEAVANISWHDAVGFCEWLSHAEKRPYRLPTEAEWEYACRAGTETPFAFGATLPDGFQKWRTPDGARARFFPDGRMPPDYRDRPAEAPMRVGQTPANAWGLFDMHGNVEEWCLDWYGPYEAGDATDPVGRADGDFRVARGGGESDFSRMLRSANRSGRLPETRSGRIGVRVVQAGPPPGAPLPPLPPAGYARDVSRESAPAARPPSGPLFSGPKPFVKIPAGSCGPLFSAHNHSPGIAECPNGDLLAVWYSCVDESGPELMVAASRLRRGADAWDEASPFWDGPDVNDHAPKLWFDGDRTLWFFARGHAENVIRSSTDNGVTWSRARVVQPCAEFANAPIRTREGFLVVPHDSRATSLILSRDGGDTWTAPDAGGTRHIWRDGGQGRRLAGIHNGLVQLGDGRLMAMGRLDDPAAQELFGFRTPVSLSSDWGATWTHAASPFPAISSVQRPVLMRLREGPLLFCSFTDQWRDWKNRKGMPFADASGGTFTGFGLFAALSEDDGRTWPVRKLLTSGGPSRQAPMIDRGEFALGDTTAEPCGYLAACQTRDGNVQLITSKNHYVFNLAWLKALPAPPARDGAP